MFQFVVFEVDGSVSRPETISLFMSAGLTACCFAPQNLKTCTSGLHRVLPHVQHKFVKITSQEKAGNSCMVFVPPNLGSDHLTRLFLFVVVVAVVCLLLLLLCCIISGLFSRVFLEREEEVGGVILKMNILQAKG